MIVAYIGKAGSGKDYQCYLLEEKGYIKIAFADKLRDMIAKIIHLDYTYMMNNYDELKHTELVNKQTLRNLMENLGSVMREIDPLFWVKQVLNKIEKDKNYCISDMRYLNEYTYTSNWCQVNGIGFKAIFCDYHSERYEENNPHASADLSNKLSALGYKDLQEIRMEDILNVSREQLRDY